MYPVEANELFLEPRRVRARSICAIMGFEFHDWSGEKSGHARLVVSWDQPEGDVEALCKALEGMTDFAKGKDRLKQRIWLAIARGACLAGCGGGGGGGTSPPAVADADKDTVADASDCAPTDATKWQALSHQSIDLDGDGHRANATGQVCSGMTLPSGYFTAAAPANDVDCDDGAAQRWQVLQYEAVDADADGHFVASVGSACSGNALDEKFGTTAPTRPSTDCNDDAASSMARQEYLLDADGDGVGGTRSRRVHRHHCARWILVFGYDLLDDPADPDAASLQDDGFLAFVAGHQWPLNLKFSTIRHVRQESMR